MPHADDTRRDVVPVALGRRTYEIHIGEGLLQEAGRLVASAIEHHAVIETCHAMRSRGFEVAVLPVDGTGRVDPADVESAAVPGRTALVAVMAANNEVGTIQPVAEIGAICRDRGVLFLCDAAQAVGRIPVNFHDLDVTTLSLSAHKFHGPKGTGALLIRKNSRLVPQLFGGHQQQGSGDRVA